MSWTVILLAGGSGQRMGAPVNKVFLSVGGETCLSRSMRAFAPFAGRMVIVCRDQDRDQVLREMLPLRESGILPLQPLLASGGDTRQRSVLSGLQACVPFEEEDFVLIHDAARCLVSPEVIRNVMEACLSHGSGVAAVPVSDTIKAVSKNASGLTTPDRSRLFAAQTPQGFRARTLLSCALRAEEEGFTGTDDASLLEHYGLPVHLAEGSRKNLKLTTPEDIMMANATLRAGEPPFRIGQGYDVHQLVPDRRLILCGVDIPFEKGLLGHSDADVALHALMDALLGAAALGDIGKHFPDTDPRYQGISSLLLLEHVMALLREHGFAPVNVDLTIVAQRPKLLPYMEQMKKNVAEKLGLPEERVSLKATTTEHLGFEGRQEGISAQAVCLLQLL